MMKKWKEGFFPIVFDENGQMIPLVAVLLVVLLGLTAFTVDVGFLYYQRRHLQNTADAASLAGAWALIDGDNVYQEVKKYVEAHGFNENDIENENEIKGLGQGDTEVPVKLKTNRTLFFARVLGFQDADVASLAVAEVVSKPGSLIPNHVIISFDEHGQIRFSGAGAKPKLESHGPISVFGNNHINNNGNHKKHEFANPVAYYCGALTGNHHESLFTGGLIKKDKTQMLVSPFADILNSNTIDSSAGLQSAFQSAGFTFASYDYYYTDGQTSLYNEEGDRLARHNQSIELNYSGHPRLVYIDGDVERGGNRSVTIETGSDPDDQGVGLVIIDGELTLRCRNLNLEGILYATEDIDFGGNVAGDINGALWSEKDVWFHGTPSALFQNTIAESAAPGQATYSVRLKH